MCPNFSLEAVKTSTFFMVRDTLYVSTYLLLSSISEISPCFFVTKMLPAQVTLI